MHSSIRGRRTLLAYGLTAAFSTLTATSASAQAYPSKPVTIVVPFSAGGTTDILARIVGQALAAELGQPFVVDNKGGAGGIVGGQIAASAPADGYTLFMGTVGTHAINASLYKRMPFDPVRDFAPITRVANAPNLLVANPAQPYKSVGELIAYARANPAKVTYGSSGNGTSIHLSGELFKSMTKLDMQHIPYKGSAPAVADLLSNQIAIMFDNMPSAIRHVRAGKLIPLAVTTAKRSPELPNVPTVAEAGVQGYEATSWFGLFAPARTPAPVLNKLNAAITKVLAQQDVASKISDQGAEPYTESRQQFAAFIKAESTKWGKVVKESGAQLD